MQIVEGLAADEVVDTAEEMSLFHVDMLAGGGDGRADADDFLYAALLRQS